MSSFDPSHSAAGSGEPLQQFSNCHAGILKQLNSLAQLPGLARAAAVAIAVLVAGGNVIMPLAVYFRIGIAA